MRVSQSQLEITVRNAIAVFAKFGVDVKGLYPIGDEVKNLSSDAIQSLFLAKLKKARNRIMMKYHQDKTGSKDAAQEINSAYDILKQPGATRMPNLTAGGVDWSQGWEEYENQPRRSATTETPVWAMAGFSGAAHPAPVSTGKITPTTISSKKPCGNFQASQKKSGLSAVLMEICSAIPLPFMARQKSSTTWPTP